MGILKGNFSNIDTAQQKIKESISDYYKSNYNDFYSKNADLINSAVVSVQKAFRQNSFPKMKVAYDSYPEHIGHLESDGCFRCHNDAFKSADGHDIPRNCDLCHTIVGQGKQGEMQYTNIKENLAFQHPVDIGTAWKESNCSECHKFLY